MVKGVNKTIIEINNTESEYFDRILLFVKASHSADTGKLDKEIAKISRTLSSDTRRIPLRKSASLRKKKLLFAALIPLAAAIISAVVIIVL